MAMTANQGSCSGVSLLLLRQNRPVVSAQQARQRATRRQGHDALPQVAVLRRQVVAGITARSSGYLLDRPGSARSRQKGRTLPSDRPEVVTAVSSVHLRIYPLQGDEGTRYMPHLSCSIAFNNVGSQAGRVLASRIVLYYPEVPVPDAKEVFRVYAEANSSTNLPGPENLWTWLEESAIGRGEPFVLSPKESVEKHFIYSGSWKSPVVQSKVRADLEVFADTKKKWMVIETWNLVLLPIIWSELINNRTSITYAASGHPDIHEGSIPEDLHTYTSPKEALPSKGLGWGPTNIKYPNED
jgi:hypothetical protein